MYTGTMQLQECSYCPNIRPPGQLKPYTVRFQDEEDTYLACEKCAEKLDAMARRIAVKAREALAAQAEKMGL